MSQSAANPPPKDNLLRHAAIAAALTVIIYVAVFAWFQHARTGKGPWEITFVADAAGHPSLQIVQAKLQISEKVVFPDDTIPQTNVAELIKFRESTTNLPFGQMLMQDALYLPGTITLRLAGHLVEILPRTLVLDKTEHPWKAGEEMVAPKARP